MISKLFALSFVIAAALAPMSIAYGSTARIMKKMEQEVRAKSKKPKDKGMCENFTGSWRGTCTSSGGYTLEDSINFSQDSCYYFEISGDGYFEDFETGVVERMGSSNFDVMFDFQATGITEWDIARKILTQSGNGIYKSINRNYSGTIDFKRTYEIVDGQLRTRLIRKSVSSNGPAESPYTEECLYSK